MQIDLGNEWLFAADRTLQNFPFPRNKKNTSFVASKAFVVPEKMRDFFLGTNACFAAILDVILSFGGKSLHNSCQCTYIVT